MFLSIISSLQIITILLTNLIQSLAITNNNQFKRHINTSPDWEIGLREATYHALVRERRIKHPHLKEYLYSAPLLGRQDSATPFGDIAIIARGQLYSAPGGFQFVQDPYQNDCDGCHNTPLRCDRSPCEYWTPQDHERLLALWSIKRIRHRDSQYGFRYDFEYKISPMSSINGKPFITRNGNFDYSINGHKFIVQRDNVHDLNPYKHYFLPYDSDQWLPNYHDPNLNSYLPPLLPPNEEEYSDEDRRNQPYGPNGHKDVPPYKPEIFPTTTTPTKQTTTFTKDMNHDLYNNAIGTLTTKLTTRYIQSSTMKTTSEDEFLFPKQKSTAQTKIPFLPTLKKPILSSTTKMQFPTNTDTTPPTYFSQNTPPTRYSESTRFVKYSEPDPLYSNTMLTTPVTKFIPTISQKYTRPSTTGTTSDSDYNMELFGGPPTTPRVTSMKFPQSTNDYMLFGEHAITVVSPPNIPLKQENVDITTIPLLIDRFSTDKMQPTQQKPTTSSSYDKPTTSLKTTPFKLNAQPTELTKTTQKAFYITKKPLQSAPPATSSTIITNITTTTEEKRDKTTTKNHVTSSLQEIKTTPSETTDAFEEEQKTTHSTQITSNDFDTNDNTIDTSISTDASTGHTVEIKTTITYPTEEYFETTTPQVRTTKAPTTTSSTVTTVKPKSSVKTTVTANRPTTHFPLETSVIDDSIFQLNFFGNPLIKPTLSTFTSYPTPSSSSDADDIFGNAIKHINTDTYQTIQDNEPKIIFSNFFLPSSMYYPTETTLNSAEVEYTEDNVNGTVDPVTSQSYITSVSFEVNKKQKTTTMHNIDDPKSTETDAIDNTVVPSTQTAKEELNEITQNSNILDSLTMSILSHAKSISYLNDEKSENRTTRSKRNVRKKLRKLIHTKRRK